MSTKKNATKDPLPALGPADVRITGEAIEHLKNTIGQITEALTAGLRSVNIPVGQANAVKAAYHDLGWTVEIHKCNGLIAELRFSAPDDPPLKDPTPLELVLEARRALVETMAMIPTPRPQ